MGFFDFLRGRSGGSWNDAAGYQATLLDGSGVTSVMGFGNSFTACGPDGITSGLTSLDAKGNGYINAFGPDGFSTTFANGNVATTFGPNGEVSTTTRCGNVFTTFGPDGRTHTTYGSGNTFTTID